MHLEPQKYLEAWGVTFRAMKYCSCHGRKRVNSSKRNMLGVKATLCRKCHFVWFGGPLSFGVQHYCVLCTTMSTLVFVQPVMLGYIQTNRGGAVKRCRFVRWWGSLPPPCDMQGTPTDQFAERRSCYVVDAAGMLVLLVITCPHQQIQNNSQTTRMSQITTACC